MQHTLSKMTASALCLLMLALNALPAVYAADSKLPAAIAGLLPTAAKLDGGDWAVMDTEFGKTYSGGMRAEFPGQPSSCDITIGPELRVTIKGDTAWEEPPMLDMLIDIHTSEIQQARASLPGSVKNMLKTNSGVTSIGDLQDEKLAPGRLLYIEFKENCKRHSGPATVLQGFSRKGAMTMTFELMQTKQACPGPHHIATGHPSHPGDTRSQDKYALRAAPARPASHGSPLGTLATNDSTPAHLGCSARQGPATGGSFAVQAQSSAAETRALAAEMISKFQKLDSAALIR